MALSSFVRLLGTTLVILISVDCTSLPNNSSPNDLEANAASVTDGPDSKFFLQQVFDKYGENGVMTFTKFEQLLESLGLQRLFVLDANHDNNQHSEMHVASHFSNSIHPKTELSDKSTEKLQLNSAKQSHGLAIDKRHAGSHGTHAHSHEDSHETHTDVSTDVSSDSSHQCFNVTDIFNIVKISTENGTISTEQFLQLCPAIVYELDLRQCTQHDHGQVLQFEKDASASVWVYASVSVLIISLSGLLVVAVIPIMQGAFYQLLLQFLVALAIGALVGDALLHLLPHALVEDIHQSHGHSETLISHHSHGQTNSLVLKGLVAVMCILLFFIIERVLIVISLRRKHRRAKHSDDGTKGELELTKSVGEKLCKHKQDSYGYRYDEVTVDVLQGLNDSTLSEKDHHNCTEKTDICSNEFQDNAETKMLSHSNNVKIIRGSHPQLGEGDHFDNSKVNGVIVTEHEHCHHGHSHTHAHAVPTSITAVAWMVIMGDGIHNFSDGLAIGAAFASSISGGISTSIAVFCHELPHELGDFAVLLKSGMTAKQALAYNGLSSALCFLGMLLGVMLGNIASVTSWIFAGAAGMFLYIALVDMIPELNSSPVTKSARDSDKLRFGVQLFGMIVGIIIMLLIAIYEHDLQNAVND